MMMKNMNDDDNDDNDNYQVLLLRESGWRSKSKARLCGNCECNHVKCHLIFEYLDI